MAKERNREPFKSIGADIKAARKALGYTQKSFAETIRIDPRYLANIENSGSLPSLPVFYAMVSLCKLPVERYFYPQAEEPQESSERERIILKLNLCQEKYLSAIESAIDELIKLGDAEQEHEENGQNMSAEINSENKGDIYHKTSLEKWSKELNSV